MEPSLHVLRPNIFQYCLKMPSMQILREQIKSVLIIPHGENQFVSVLGDAGNDTHVGFNVTISNAAGECDIEQYVSNLFRVTITQWAVLRAQIGRIA